MGPIAEILQAGDHVEDPQHVQLEMILEVVSRFLHL